MKEIKRITLSQVGYVQPLINLASPPKGLYFKGRLPDTRRTTVAIIGSRRPTSYGKEVTYELAYKLAKQGIIIISGLAHGVDAIAHRAALDAGGITIAILGNGLDSVYPGNHRQLAETIIKRGGAVISEYAPDMAARKHHFLARNRIISGLADAIVVTEATAKSGTLSTVNHALDQNKEVFAVPGNITSLLSVGPNTLIQQGAHPVVSVESILEVIAPQKKTQQASLPIGETPLETQIIQLIHRGVRDSDQLLRESGSETSQFLIALTMLELHGNIKSLGSNQWIL